MNNADMPAMPISVSHSPLGDLLTTDDYGVGMGLTKREHFAAMFLQGSLAAGDHSRANKQDIVGLSIEYADLLLKELNK